MDTAKLLSWHATHFRPARVRDDRWATPIQGEPGFPDLVLARHGVVLLVELKRHGGRLSEAQKVWARAIGSSYRLWTPTQWNDGSILGELKGG